MKSNYLYILFALTTSSFLAAKVSNAQPNYPSLFLANQNTTGAVQTPLSLGNWNGTQTTVPSFNFNTYDDGTSHLDAHATRWGTSVVFSRADPDNTSHSVATIGGTNSAGGLLWLYNASNQVTVAFNGQGNTYFTGGNVLIGKNTQTNTSYLLDVNGSERANSVVVNTTGADFVFAPRYQLSSLKDLDTYIHKEHHLPGIVPAEQMQKEGLNLGDNQTRLLQKIEELTLYLIEQDKKTTTLEAKIRQLEERNGILENLEQRIEALENPDKKQP